MDAIGNEHKMGKLEKVHDEEQGNEMAEGDESLGTPEEPIAQYVKLISSDKHVFIIEKLYVLISKKIREMLEVAGSPGQDYSTVNLNEMPSHILEKVCQYLQYKVRYSSIPCPPSFFDDITPEMAADVSVAATYLECE